MTPVILHWVDAHADPSGGWVQVRDVDQRAYTVTSVGYLVPADEGGKPGHVSICQSVGRMDGDDEPDALDSILHVPVGMVVRMVACV